MHIIIVGGGIAGLSTYLSLQKYLPKHQGHTIAIYEAHDLTPYIQAVVDTSTNASKKGTTGTSGTSTGREKPGAAAAIAAPEADEAPAAFTPEVIGSAIGISYNGLAVLFRLATTQNGAAIGKATHDGHDGRGEYSPMIASMLRASHPITHWHMSSARGWDLVDFKMAPPSKAKTSSGDKSSGDGVTGIMIPRQSFWQVLLAEVVRVVTAEHSEAGINEVLKQGRVKEMAWAEQYDPNIDDGVSKCYPGRERSAVEVVFEDGRKKTANLVIGADGVRSVVRREMFGGRQRCNVERERNNEPDFVAPKYEGLVGVGGFIPSSVLQSAKPAVQSGAMGIVFGANGFFGYGYCSSGNTSDQPTLHNVSPSVEPGKTAVWWSTFASKDENPYPIPAQDNSKRPRPWDFDRNAALSALVERHRSWSNPTIKAILDYVESSSSSTDELNSAVEGFYPTYTTPQLPTWHKGPVVLVGDAAHALQPSSGQGACQALEDAETLATCLSHYLRKPRDPNRRPDITVAIEKIWIGMALDVFEKVRMPRVKQIYERSQRMGKMKDNMGVVMEMMMYGAIKVMSFLGGLFGGDRSMDLLLGYDLPAEVQRALEAEGRRRALEAEGRRRA